VVALGILLNKIRHYISTLTLIKGLFISIALSSFIYLEYFGISYKIVDTLLALSGFFILLKSPKSVWFVSGFVISLLWFWWIGVSFIHYDMAYLIPFLLLAIGLIYAMMFYLVAYISEFSTNQALSLAIKISGIISLGYIHPFGFDWFKPQLIFINSYLGVELWRFVLLLIVLCLYIYTKKPYILLGVLLAYHPSHITTSEQIKDIKLITTHISVKDKWDESKKELIEARLLSHIDHAIEQNYSTVILPESSFVSFINYDQKLFDKLTQRAKHINIITGGLFLEGRVPRNSTYIFTQDGKVQVAHKHILVPFGESNPLPKFLSDWVNETFYGGAVDYKASDHISTYKLDDKTYTNAICFEATSDKLYQNHPKAIIAISNNGWFYPSTEPTLQKLLLKYYATIYHTTIYHAINMSKSYVLTE